MDPGHPECSTLAPLLVLGSSVGQSFASGLLTRLCVLRDYIYRHVADVGRDGYRHLNSSVIEGYVH